MAAQRDRRGQVPILWARLTGKMVQIRAADGEHFTPAGELLVAALSIAQNDREFECGWRQAWGSVRQLRGGVNGVRPVVGLTSLAVMLSAGVGGSMPAGMSSRQRSIASSRSRVSASRCSHRSNRPPSYARSNNTHCAGPGRRRRQRISVEQSRTHRAWACRFR